MNQAKKYRLTQGQKTTLKEAILLLDKIVTDIEYDNCTGFSVDRIDCFDIEEIRDCENFLATILNIKFIGR